MKEGLRRILRRKSVRLAGHCVERLAASHTRGRSGAMLVGWIGQIGKLTWRILLLWTADRCHFFLLFRTFAESCRRL